jgi:hypothetical protein
VVAIIAILTFWLVLIMLFGAAITRVKGGENRTRRWDVGDD